MIEYIIRYSGNVTHNNYMKILKYISLWILHIFTLLK